MRLSSLHARQILDSRGNPTVEVEAELTDGSQGRAAVPSGASTGRHESVELRDNNPRRYHGKSVERAVRIVNEQLREFLIDNDVGNQTAVDQELVMRDGTDNLGRFGANSILAVSLAISKAAAASLGLPYYRYIRQLMSELDGQPARRRLPTPMFNVINGGAHTGWQTTSFQEFMLVPLAGKTFADKLEMGSELYHQLETVLKEAGLQTMVGDEGGFAPQLHSDEQALELLLAAITRLNLKPGEDVAIALDPAMSELYQDGQYLLKNLPESSDRVRSTAQLIEQWQDWVERYPIISLEDGLAEDDWAGWVTLNERLGDRLMIVGDDLLVTNPGRIEKAITERACNALLMKVNQIGTLTESLQAVRLAQRAGWQVVVSHRSGETEDTSIADIAVGAGAGYVKVGAPARGERTAKYNQLLRIEEQLQAEG
ncbi:MAG: phosphopyruvate hydratase [Candidatus Pacebacteria bacterium CG10_big_fil_rev_8_21_14_0_10_56_10]|nr:MAG: phosphopyruvate hydratase [Candidatus Pacebacteria bacterium CG10_big_fil_rev_8_21_14_0_10_56_10]